MRISWENYALKLAEVAAERSEDIYLKVGSCALRHDHSVAGIGYNGPPAGINIDWSNRDERRKRIVHSEINCLRYCKPGECYLIACTLLPCNSCLTVIASYGIKKIVYGEIYDKDDSTLKLAAEFGIELVQTKKEKPKLNPNFVDFANFEIHDMYKYQGFMSPGYLGDPLPDPLHIGRKVKVVRGQYAGKSGIITAHWGNGDDCSGNYNQQLYSLDNKNDNTNSFGINVKDCELLD